MLTVLETLGEADFATVYRAGLDHNVLVVHGQELDIEAYLRYSRRFGVLEPHPPKSTRHPEYPEITMLGANKFDADGTLNMAIYRRARLYAVAIPSRGGDTLFATMYAAYEALPQSLKDRLDGEQGAFAYGGGRNARATRGGRSRLEACIPSDCSYAPGDGT